MEFEDQDDHDEEMEMAASYDSLQPHNNNNNNNSGGAASQPGRVKMPASSSGAGEVSASASAARPRYRECLKNHAVGLGGHALDGCGEFLPAGPDGTIDALKCAACHCHRNFHRKDSEPPGRLLLPPEPYSLVPSTHPHHHYGPPAAAQFSPYYRTPAGYLQVRPLALPSTSGGGGEDQEDASDVPMQAVAMMQYGSATTSSGGGGGSKKRFRTKFTAEQKEKMLGLAERLGWRIQKQDEPLVQEFCADTGVRRHVLKVWMHNNKHTLGKKP